ncbi:hypothetical protein SAMN02745664_1026 [Moraxella cuniculi DSM 21768]|uniref:Uncharacterized protein n=1 Tax=Moraxella cuniculi DSM 21768 TaxID=1122245 RepID=A0A1N7DPD6_9GAMM|nr:hypothetical protein [Moraxella cuniculi]SIR77631.1 hypothetical protein SAMN02745664_1026 [Moraxella cuniculi DSM 21768]
MKYLSADGTIAELSSPADKQGLVYLIINNEQVAMSYDAFIARFCHIACEKRTINEPRYHQQT